MYFKQLTIFVDSVHKLPKKYREYWFYIYKQILASDWIWKYNICE